MESTYERKRKQLIWQADNLDWHLTNEVLLQPYFKRLLKGRNVDFIKSIFVYVLSEVDECQVVSDGQLRSKMMAKFEGNLLTKENHGRFITEKAKLRREQNNHTLSSHVEHFMDKLKVYYVCPVCNLTFILVELSKRELKSHLRKCLQDK